MQLKAPIKCLHCKREYESVPLGRYSVDQEGHVFFDCECKGQELVGLMRPIEKAETQPSLSCPSQVGPLRALSVLVQSFRA